MMNGKDASVMKFTLVAALSVALMACKADSSGGGAESGDGNDGNVGGDGDVVSPQLVIEDGPAEGLVLYTTPEGAPDEEASFIDSLRELSRVSSDESDRLFEGLELVPQPLLLQAQYPEAFAFDRWLIGGDISEGEILAPWFLTHVSFLLAERDGVVALTPERAEMLNADVAEALAPEVQDLYVTNGKLPELPAEGSLTATDPDLIALYRLALENTVISEGQELSEDQQLHAFVRDAGAGVLDGRNRDGEPINEVQYDPVRFIPNYEPEIRDLASTYGNQSLNELVFGTEGQDGISAERFVSRDKRCEGFVDDFLANHAGSYVSLNAESVTGYDGAVTAGETTDLSLEQGGEVTLELDGGQELNLTEDDLYTCSRDNNFVRYVMGADSGLTDQREELVIAGIGTGEGSGDLLNQGGDGVGFYLATESGDQVAEFGNIDARGGYDDGQDGDPGDDPQQAACNVGGDSGYNSFADLEAETTTSGIVENAGSSIDGDAETAAEIWVAINLLGIGSSELEVTATGETLPLEDTNMDARILISTPGSPLNIGLFEVVSVEHSSTEDESDPTEILNSNLNLNSEVDLDVGGVFGDQNFSVIDVDNIESFNRLSINLGGVLSIGDRLNVHDVCYRESQSEG